jgi:PIN domain nuclease of toxin-antitoxin system
MSGILLDTHILLCWLADDLKLPASFRRVIADGSNACIVSAATVWEIGIKRALGKLHAPQHLVGVIEEEGFALLSISPMHAEIAAALPPHHRDPFDRMLIAQAACERFRIATVDARFEDYDVGLVSAVHGSDP